MDFYLISIFNAILVISRDFEGIFYVKGLFACFNTISVRKKKDSFLEGTLTIPKTRKMVLDASLLNTQHYKVRIKGKVEKSRE